MEVSISRDRDVWVAFVELRPMQGQPGVLSGVEGAFVHAAGTGASKQDFVREIERNAAALQAELVQVEWIRQLATLPEDESNSPVFARLRHALLTRSFEWDEFHAYGADGLPQRNVRTRWFPGYTGPDTQATPRRRRPT